MSEVFELGEITINLTRKSVKNVHLTVHPPEGRVTLVAPTSTRTEVARAYAISKLGWIRLQQQALRDQARESQRRYIERESHQLWGRNPVSYTHLDVYKRQRRWRWYAPWPPRPACTSS